MTARRLIVAAPVDGSFPSAPVTIGWAQQVYQCGIQTIVTYAEDVVRARNRLVAQAFESFGDFTHIIWWDVDQYVTDPTLITRMLNTGHDVIGTNYPRKRKTGERVGVPIEPRVVGPDGCIEARAIGLGLAIMSRRALENVGRTSRVYTAKNEDGSRLLCRDIFGHRFIDGDGDIASIESDDDQLVSEDYSFCARWRSLGGRVWMMPSNGVQHIGLHAFDGSVLPSG